MLPFPPDADPPLAVVRVLDAARVLAGPFCGQLLADLGADVVKLERPGTGDDTRGWGPPFLGPLSAYFLSCNRNKRSVTLDVQHPDGNKVFQDLLAKCDVLIENFRTDSAEKLGLTPDRLLARHPRLVVCSISGFGRTGPWRDAPGYDFAVQAMSGLMAITGPADGPPCKVGVAVADVLTGLYAATAILACLHPRVVNPVVDRVLRLARRTPLERPLTGRAVAVALGWALLSWLLLGCHVWILAVRLDAPPAKAFALAVGGFAFAWSAGFLAVVAPAGAGVRDLLLVAALSGTMSTGSATAIALTSRILMTVGDLVLAGLAALSRRAVRAAPPGEDS